MNYHERVYTYTCVTTNKNKKKKYSNIFGDYTYRDIPNTIFQHGTNIIIDGEYYYIATVEKALCDKLYSVSSTESVEELEYLLFNDLKINEEDFDKLNKNDLIFYASIYKSKKLKLLIKIFKKSN